MNMNEMKDTTELKDAMEKNEALKEKEVQPDEQELVNGGAFKNPGMKGNAVENLTKFIEKLIK